MADISDVTSYLQGVALSAVYPNGTSQPSIANMDVLVYEGWPVSEQLDLDLAGQSPGQPPTTRSGGPRAHVTIFPMLGSSRSAPYQIQDETYVITPAAINCAVSVNGNQITYTGTPAAGEFLTIVADRLYAFSRGGTTAAAILSALLTDIQVNYPTATLVGSVLTIPYGYELDVRQGGVGLLGKVVHRECQSVMITAWAPDHVTRNTLSAAIDVALKSANRVTLTDVAQTQAKIVYQRTNVIDDPQNKGCYRRDLIFDCEYATVQTFAGTSITSVSNQITATQQDQYTGILPVETVIT